MMVRIEIIGAVARTKTPFADYVLYDMRTAGLDAEWSPPRVLEQWEVELDERYPPGVTAAWEELDGRIEVPFWQARQLGDWLREHICDGVEYIGLDANGGAS